jgi:hypothetical protein
MRVADCGMLTENGDATARLTRDWEYAEGTSDFRLLYDFIVLVLELVLEKFRPCHSAIRNPNFAFHLLLGRYLDLLVVP